MRELIDDQTKANDTWPSPTSRRSARQGSLNDLRKSSSHFSYETMMAASSWPTEPIRTLVERPTFRSPHVPLLFTEPTAVLDTSAMSHRRADFTKMVIQSTISKDHTAGRQARDASLLASLGTRTRDCVRGTIQAGDPWTGPSDDMDWMGTTKIIVDDGNPRDTAYIPNPMTIPYHRSEEESDEDSSGKPPYEDENVVMYGDRIDQSYNMAGVEKRQGRAAPPGRCHSCNRTDTLEWRRGPDGSRTLCNACGLQYAKLEQKRQTEQSLEALPTDSVTMKRALNTLAARRSREQRSQKLEDMEEKIAGLEAERDHWKKIALQGR